jgi:hypothetical protein
MGHVKNGIPIQGIVERLSTGYCFEAHRGAFWWDKKMRIAIAFGNDGYTQDDRAKFEVECLHTLLQQWGSKELAFATDHEDGDSWALACELSVSLTPDFLEGCL